MDAALADGLRLYHRGERYMNWKRMLFTCLSLVLVLWSLSLFAGEVGGLVNLGLVIAAYVLILSLVTERRSVA